MTGDTEKPGVEEIDCLDAIDNLYAYLDGELEDPAILEQFEMHLSHCRSCYSRAEMEKALNRRIGQAGRGDAPESLQHRLRELIDKF